MGLFDDLFGNDKKKNQQAFGLFSFMNEQEKNSNSEYTDEELDNYGLEDGKRKKWKKEVMIHGILKKI